MYLLYGRYTLLLQVGALLIHEHKQLGVGITQCVNMSIYDALSITCQAMFLFFEISESLSFIGNPQFPKKLQKLIFKMLSKTGSLTNLQFLKTVL